MIVKFFSDYQHLLIFVAFLSGRVIGQDETEGGEGEKQPNKPKEKIDYSKLDLKKDLLRGSRWSIEQGKAGKIIEVFHAMEIVDIAKVDVQMMSIRVEIHLLQRWKADDLQFPDGLFQDDDLPDMYIHATPDILDSMWSPESYITGARETKIASFTVEQGVVNIFKNKTIVHKVRFYTILGCMFDFTWYPLDQQTCSLQLESYSTLEGLVRYCWEVHQAPVVLNDIKLLQYSLQHPLRNSNGSSVRWGKGGKYPFVQLDFTFERRLQYTVIQVFVPTTLIVILSWFSFWLGMDAIPGRITLLITCMLTLVTMHSGQTKTLPPVNYIKVMDLWMIATMAFVFLAMCEFIIVKFLHWRKQQELKRVQETEEKMKLYLEKVKEIDGKKGENVDVKKNRQNYNNPYLEFYRQNQGEADKYPHLAWNTLPGSVNPTLPGIPLINNDFFGPFEAYPENPNDAKPKKKPVYVIIDRVSRVLFPLCFAIFNAIFWPYLIVGSESQ